MDFNSKLSSAQAMTWIERTSLSQVRESEESNPLKIAGVNKVSDKQRRSITQKTAKNTTTMSRASK